jgi:hypothetical protein
VCPTAGLEEVAKRKIPSPCRESKPGRPAPSFVAVPNELSRFHFLGYTLTYVRSVMPRMLRWAGHVARMGKTRNAFLILVRKSLGKRPIARQRWSWENIIKMDRDAGRWRKWLRTVSNGEQC